MSTLHTDALHDGLDLLLPTVLSLSPDDWNKQSNLKGWSIRDVVAHVTGSVHKITTLVAGDDTPQLRSEPSDWYRDDQVAALRTEALQAKRAVRDADWDAPRQVRGREFTLADAVRFPIVDIAVHTWDLHRSLGERFELPLPLLEYALDLTDAMGNEPNPNFEPPISAPDDAPETERLMAQLGRQID